MIESHLEIILKLDNSTLSLDQHNKLLQELKDKFPTNKTKRQLLLSEAIEKLTLAIQAHNYKKSHYVAFYIFFTNFDNVIESCKKQGLFRASKYNYRTSLLKKILTFASHSEHITQEDRIYLSSVAGLLTAAPDVASIKAKLITAIQSRRFFLKSILAIAESKFCDLPTFTRGDRPQSHIDRIFTDNKESLTSCASLLTHYTFECAPPPNIKNNNHIDESTSEDYYLRLFYDAFKILEYNEAEIRVDYFKYIAAIDKTRKIISITNQEFEIAKSYGYTKTLLRHDSQNLNGSMNVKSQSYKDFLENVWKIDDKSDSILYKIRESPVSRITVTTLILEHGSRLNLFSRDQLFKEEIIQLTALSEENYNHSLATTPIFETFTPVEIFKIQRFFHYISFIYNKAYLDMKASNIKNADIIRRRSILPIFECGILEDIIHNISNKPHDECRRLIERLSANPEQATHFVDLQYQPIIKIESSHLVLPTIFSHSNLVRSIAISERTHLAITHERDLMTDGVANAFRTRGFNVHTDFKFGQDEADIVAIKGDHLFFFECKNPYHPVNDYELRNTHAHLTKGFIQIEKFRKKFKNNNILKQFLTNLGEKPERIKKIHYGIINANRALCGLEQDGVRVFHANEIINFLKTGEIISNRYVLRCWKKKKFQIHDLTSYLEGKVVTSDFLKEAHQIIYGLPLREKMIAFRDYEFDLSAIAKSQKKQYKVVHTIDVSRITRTLLLRR
ncbi:hypothetical protein HU720_02965 [Pseudomonas sp. SWRI51]|uniref:hypothetical protein n=1 Tax=Pseudomonas sp. SWRI51 TaxID=2745491 RepID=UPI00164598BC|nr:hypothetical protein [Pseudomonas sp. SWRI51]MBC3410258.1 hypothetical protein [Pseudomonas sp. SWRI51]